MILNEYKVCSKCKNNIRVCFFGKDKNRVDGLNYNCKSCINKKQKSSNEKNPGRNAGHCRRNYLKNHEKRVSYQKKYNQRKKLEKLSEIINENMAN